MKSHFKNINEITQRTLESCEGKASNTEMISFKIFYNFKLNFLSSDLNVENIFPHFMIPRNLFSTNILEKLWKLFQSKWNFSFISFFPRRKPRWRENETSSCFRNFSFFTRNSKEKLKVSMLPFEWEIFRSMFIRAVWGEICSSLDKQPSERVMWKRKEEWKTHNGIHCYVYIHLKKFLCVSTLISGSSPHFPAALFIFASLTFIQSLLLRLCNHDLCVMLCFQK